ncbi:DNA replication/repair protein RecF [Thermaerobacter subterraneus]|uniref:DNA replication and repair protein RecF n=1 Tax=Thermaerobacter subterraneus DSM 13965 TaxID=867903 RepID=K6PPB9_9FIRM|nr:DNA replication and repair protein RecF [Thermaerobacter subterraneus]EKP94762.1 DNA replication and repair protein RecF [Thermaerobacter subterraneus DSM 13965]
MVIRRVVLRQFRSYEQATLELDSGLTLLAGPNGIGKTNLLEAIHFAATGRSPRTTRDTDLIRHGAPLAYVRVEWDDPVAGRRVVEMALHRQHGKALRLDGRKRQRLADLQGALPIVYFAPESLALVKAGPAARRGFLDDLLGQLVPGYTQLLHDYQRVLAQRNQLLREIRAGRAAGSLLAIWDEPLYRHGQAIRQRRRRLLDELAPLAAAAAGRVAAGGAAGAGVLELDYLAAEPDGRVEGGAVSSPEGLAAFHREEVARGTTLWGPQRDDFALFLDGQDARAFASQGQQRALALALTLAQVELIHRRLGRWPVLLLDDVLSELDGKRRRYLLEAVCDLPQVILTATEPPEWPEGTRPRVIPLPLGPEGEAEPGWPG